MIHHHLGPAAEEADKAAALSLIKGRIEETIRREGVFTVHSQAGLFVLRKD